MTADRATVQPRRSLSPFWRLWLAGLALFVVAAVLAAFYDRFPADPRIARAIQDFDVPAWGGAAGFTNQAGGTLWASVSWVVAIAALAALARWRDASYLAVTIAPRGVNALVKLLVDRPRPSAELVRVSENAPGSAFPSGHVTAALTFYLLLFVVAFFVVRQPGLRWALQGFCLFMALMVGPGRVYSGAHWPSDVLGGYLMSALFLIPTLRFYWRGRQAATPIVQ
jgi:undecaprenyl-diphosphatase